MHRMKPIGKNAGRNCRHAHPYWRVLFFLVVFSWSFASAANEDDHQPHRHEALAADPGLGWPELVDRTLTNYPRYVELAARNAEAAALQKRGKSLLAQAPIAHGVYLSDQAFDDTNLAEYELGIEMPLWHWNERSAAQQLGEAAGSESAAAATALRLRVTGLLRDALWDIESATVDVAVAEDGVAIAEELLRVVTRRYETGDLPLTDALLARSALLEQQAQLLDSQSVLVDAERNYRSLTGLDRRPVEFAETPHLQEALDDSHPWLVMANARVSRAQAEQDLVEKSARDAPSLTVGTRRERGAYSDTYFDSLGFQLKVPFGGGAHRDVEVSASLRALSSAKADRAELRRQLELDLHEAHHSLSVADASLALARERAELASRNLQMSERAFAQGEMTLFELLQQQGSAQRAQSESARLEVERQRAIAQINQALGEQP